MQGHMSAWRLLAHSNSPHLLVKDYLEERGDWRCLAVSHDRSVERALTPERLLALKKALVHQPLHPRITRRHYHGCLTGP